jgi:hypothetical protein
MPSIPKDVDTATLPQYRLSFTFKYATFFESDILCIFLSKPKIHPTLDPRLNVHHLSSCASNRKHYLLGHLNEIADPNIFSYVMAKLLCWLVFRNQELTLDLWEMKLIQKALWRRVGSIHDVGLRQ